MRIAGTYSKKVTRGGSGSSKSIFSRPVSPSDGGSVSPSAPAISTSSVGVSIGCSTSAILNECNLKQQYNECYRRSMGGEKEIKVVGGGACAKVVPASQAPSQMH